MDGYHTKIKQLKRLSYGFRNRDRYRRKMFLGFLPLTAIPPIIDVEPGRYCAKPIMSVWCWKNHLSSSSCNVR
ncbi:MAG: hypothetical protein K6U14_05330 [Firmicutes bacterium]|nr:hypothetical protein [Alicyclobacillaceae bacterium]MCL6497041.1 hypothetical protein [Bacillota bacterium]